jgi:type 1 glutamine amidotransferase
MKNPFCSLFTKAAPGLLALGLALPAGAAEPKKLLVVTVTTGFRHSSIPVAEKILARLAKESGAFTVEFCQQPSNKPNVPRKPAAPKDDADEATKQKYKADLAAWEAETAKARAAEADFNTQLKRNLEMLSPANLRKYDGVIFANTTGDLPLPDRQAFVDWVQAGHAFIGMHSASDTFHGFRPFIEMLGGEFQSHGAQAGVDCLNEDTVHPACKHLSASWSVFDEIYLMKSFDRAKVHMLLGLDKEPNKKTPGYFPVAWCKQVGQGRVFYTSLGHREDIWDEEWKQGRKNAPEVSKAYQAHILGGIKWALGLEAGSAEPQTK